MRGEQVFKRLSDASDLNVFHASAKEREGLSLIDYVGGIFDTFDALVFVSSTGIAVRAIAPHVKSKMTDPAVIVIDEKGDYAVSLLSGHVGGSNKLTEQLSDILSAQPVITTATDRFGLLAIDEWANNAGLSIANPDQIKTISSRVLGGNIVTIYSDVKFSGDLPEYFKLVKTKCNADVIISEYRYEYDSLHLVPSNLILGIGTRKGVGLADIEKSVEALLAKNNIHPKSIRSIASIDLKRDEKGIVHFAQKNNLPYKTYTSEQLGKVKGSKSESDFVRHITGVDSVSERASLVEGEKLIVPKTAANGIALAISKISLVLTMEELA